jgi:hypothetical protein
MKLQTGTIVSVTPEQAESLLTLVNDQIEDLRHCIRKQAEEQHPDQWITNCLIRFITHYRNIKRTLNDLHYLNPVNPCAPTGSDLTLIEREGNREERRGNTAIRITTPETFFR